MSQTLSNLAHEDRRFPPPPQFTAAANVTADIYAEADADRSAFWAQQAERLSWAEKWTDVLDWSDPPFAKWFVGCSASAQSDGVVDCDARIVITADGGYRRGAPSALKPAVDEAMTKCPDVRNVLVVKRTEQDIEWTEGRDVWWHDLVGRQSAE